MTARDTLFGLPRYVLAIHHTATTTTTTTTGNNNNNTTTTTTTTRQLAIRAGYTAPHGGALGTAEVESCRGDQSTDADCRPVRARRLS